MKKIAIFLLLSFFALTSPTAAQEDQRARAASERIAESTLTMDIMAGAINSQFPLMMMAMQPSFERLKLTQQQSVRFVEIIMDEMLTNLISKIRAFQIELYIQEFSVTELEEMADFFESDTGLAYLKKSPELMQAGAVYGAQLGAEFNEENAARVFSRFEEEGFPVNPDNFSFDDIL